jgi:hypothetical protein
VLPRPLGDAIPEIERINLGEDPPGRDTFVGYHRDLKRLARPRALLELVIARISGASRRTQPTPYHRTSRGAIQSVPTDSTSQRPG